ncbi:hypothetical protein LSCM1_06995 [Leishmania martiniquensis]|uniref:Uncharacterized protein n=1 Tax=Leishmania martiniquensis TaxID=1580590 RepID=A0A836GZC0_9TRYP|nr:hypothetical protein LSCM1_06995 [Leishmania martiniquensis]
MCTYPVNLLRALAILSKALRCPSIFLLSKQLLYPLFSPFLPSKCHQKATKMKTTSLRATRQKSSRWSMRMDTTSGLALRKTMRPPATRASRSLCGKGKKLEHEGTCRDANRRKGGA